MEYISIIWQLPMFLIPAIIGLGLTAAGLFTIVCIVGGIVEYFSETPGDNNDTNS